MNFLDKKQVILAALAIMISSNSYSQSGSTAGANTQGANPDLEYCPESLGTLTVYENQGDDWYSRFNSTYPDLGSTEPLIRLMVQQSNCFVVVERGNALNNIYGERDLQASGELRDNSNFGKGQMVSADYTLSPSVLFADKTGGIGGALGGFLRSKNSTLADAVGGLSKKEASTTLLLVDNRSSVQVAAATGSAQKFDFSGGLDVLGRSGGGAISGYTDTPEGKVIAAAFADSYNEMVRALRIYDAQSVDGGLGTGGKLKVGQ